MSNIRGFGDIENNNNNNNNNNNIGLNIPQGQGPPDNIPFLMGYFEQNQKDPRSENFLDFLKYSCCPHFEIRQFIVITTIVQIIYFIISLSLSSEIKGEFLQPSTLSVIELGAKYPYNMKQGYIWLFLTPVLLHANFMHIFSNLVSQLIFGTELEKRIGTLKMISLYILSAISGNLLSALISDSLSVGASTAIFGILACLLGYLVVNWDALERYGTMRCMVLCMIIIMIMLNVLVGLGNKSTIDNYGHLGGFIIGINLSFILVVPIQPNQTNALLKKIGTAFIFVYFAAGFTCFYALRNPIKLNY